MTFLLSTQKLMRTFKNEGFLKGIGYIQNKLIRRNKYYVFEMDVSQTPIINKELWGEFRLIDTQDIKKLISFWIKYYQYQYPLHDSNRLVSKLIETRINDGELCFIREYKGKIIYFHWVSILNQSNLNKKELLRYLQFIPLEHSYHYNCFAHPKYRGLKSMITAYSFISSYLKEKHCKKMYSCVEYKNLSSIKIHKEIEARHIQDLYVTRFPLFEKAKSKNIYE